MKIEKLEPSRHRQGRWLVWLEDGSLVRLGEGEVVSLSLYSGKELTEEEGEALAAAEIQGRLNERAVALLSARPMSRRELVDKLSAPARRRKKPSREADEVQPDPEALEREREALRQGAERAADWLEGLGLLNDGEYAGAVARHYAEKGYGPRKIQDELYRRGVPRAFWAEAMDGVSQGANGANPGEFEAGLRLPGPPGLFLGGDRPGGGAVPPSGRGIAAFQHLSSAEPR